MHTRTCILLNLAALTLLNATGVQAGERDRWWPQFRGPEVRGIATAGNYPTEFGTDENLLWKMPLPSGVSSPCVWGNRIFITAHDAQQNKLETICLGRESGEIQWRQTAPAEQIEKPHKVSSPANATPATDGDHVVVYFASFGLICYDIAGNEEWHVQLPFIETAFGSGTSPVIVGDQVVLNRDQMPDLLKGRTAKIRAWRLSDGEEAWQTARPPSFVHYSTPVVWNGPDGKQILLMGSNRLTAYDAASGKELWWVVGLPPQVCATPQVIGEYVYVTATGMFGEPETFIGLPDFEKILGENDKNDDGQLGIAEVPDDVTVVDRRASGGAGNSPLKQFLGGIDMNRDKQITQQEWDGFAKMFGSFVNQNPPGVFAIKLGGDGDVSETNITWTTRRGVAEVPSLLVLDNRMFVVRNGGIVHCRDLATGNDIYRGRLGALGGYYASPVAADGKVYFCSDRGVVTVIDAESPKLKVVAQNDLGERIMATPALVEGNIYIRTDGYMYAFGN